MKHRRFYRRFSLLNNKEDNSLNIVSLIDIMAVIIFFLLMYAVAFSKLVMLELNLPGPNDAAPPQKPELNLQVSIHADSLIVDDGKGGPIVIAAVAGKQNYKQLSEVLRDIKLREPAKKTATVLATPDTSYDALIQTMDAMRSYVYYENNSPQIAELFPDISMGDTGNP